MGASLEASNGRLVETSCCSASRCSEETDPEADGAVESTLLLISPLPPRFDVGAREAQSERLDR
jgi:hypothetical protein